MQMVIINLGGSAATRHADVYHNVETSERTCTCHRVQNCDKSVTGMCSRAHAHSRHLKMLWISVATEWKVLSKAIFCDGRLKMGSARTSDIRWELALADGFQTQVFYMFIIFLELCFSHSLVASDKAKTKHLFHKLWGLRQVRVRGRVSGRWGRNLLIH